MGGTGSVIRKVLMGVVVLVAVRLIGKPIAAALERQFKVEDWADDRVVAALGIRWSHIFDIGLTVAAIISAALALGFTWRLYALWRKQSSPYVDMSRETASALLLSFLAVLLHEGFRHGGWWEVAGWSLLVLTVLTWAAIAAWTRFTLPTAYRRHDVARAEREWSESPHNPAMQERRQRKLGRQMSRMRTLREPTKPGPEQS